jgi:hypothetical protein
MLELRSAWPLTTEGMAGHEYCNHTVTVIYVLSQRASRDGMKDEV